MKRKRSPLLTEPASRKKSTNKTTARHSYQTCLLIQLLEQYGILECIASHLFPTDLYSLAATSKSAYKSIFFRPESRSSLLGKMNCDGEGVKIRRARHMKSKYFYDYGCTDYVTCGAHDPTEEVESRPCVSCGATTCDECRIHCVYQSIRQPPDEPDELPSYSGFVLLYPQEMGILSPAHLKMSEFALWKPPYHDQGFLDIPVESSTYATPETIKLILGFNLGKHSLNLGDSSGNTCPSSIIQPFWEITEKRKRAFCTQCFAAETGRHDSPATCNCTLRNHFLDRWLCLRCYLKEEQSIEAFACEDRPCSPKQCNCGQRLTDSATRILCLWCKGEVSNPHLRTNPSKSS